MSSAATTVLDRGARASAVALILIVLPAAAFAASQGPAAVRAAPVLDRDPDRGDAAHRRVPRPLYWEAAAGTLWLEIPKLDEEVLYLSGLSTGVGSNDIALDRGERLGGRVVSFRRVGPKILMVQPNYRFRAVSGSPDERRAVEESFGTSVIWGFTVAAESAGRVLVDTYRLPPARCARRGLAAGARHLPPRSLAERHLHASHEGFPQEHRDGGDAHLHRRRQHRRRGRAGSRPAPSVRWCHRPIR